MSSWHHYQVQNDLKLIVRNSLLRVKEIYKFIVYAVQYMNFSYCSTESDWMRTSKWHDRTCTCMVNGNKFCSFIYYKLIYLFVDFFQVDTAVITQVVVPVFVSLFMWNPGTHYLFTRMGITLESKWLITQGRNKTQVWLHRASKFCSWESDNIRSSGTWWASELLASVILWVSMKMSAW